MVVSQVAERVCKQFMKKLEEDHKENDLIELICRGFDTLQYEEKFSILRKQRMIFPLI